MLFRRIASFFAFVIAAAAALCGPIPSARADVCYGADPYNSRIVTVDLATGTLSNAVAVTLTGFTPSGITALTASPKDGSLWGIVKTGTGSTGRMLCRIDPATGVATLVGAVPDGFSSLSFDPAGILFGMTGQGGSPASTLYTLNPVTGAATAIYGPVISGPDGEVIAFAGGTLYHSSGNGGASFDIINLNTNTTNSLGTGGNELFGLGYSASSATMYATTIDSQLVRIDVSTGARTIIGATALGGGGNVQVRGLAIISSPPGICYGAESFSSRIFTVDLATGALSNSVPVTLAGFTPSGITALTASPVDGTVWGILKTGGSGTASRKLCRIDPTTGVATLVGAAPDGFSSLSFDPAGLLLGMTGSGGTPASTLYTLNTITGTSSAVYGPVVSGLDGEVIAFGPGGVLYHSSGNGTATFSIINLDTNTTTPIVTTSGEMFGMAYNPKNLTMYGTDISSNLFRINLASGARTLIGTTDFRDGSPVVDVRGLAIVQPLSGAASGACCAGGGVCIITTPGQCIGGFVGLGTTCSPKVLGGTANACCKADYNSSGILEVQDIFDFLNGWFASCP